MRLAFVVKIEDDLVICRDVDGTVIELSSDKISVDVAEDMPLLIDQKKSGMPYNGAFRDPEDRLYKHIQWEDGKLTLKERRPPLTVSELQAILEEPFKTNDSKWAALTELIIDNLIGDGKIELAYALMDRIRTMNDGALVQEIWRKPNQE